MNSSYWLYSFALENSSVRAQLREFLSNKKIETRPVFPLISDMPGYLSCRRETSLSADLSGRGVSIPSWPSMSISDQCYVIDSVRMFFGLKNPSTNKSYGHI